MNRRRTALLLATIARLAAGDRLCAQDYGIGIEARRRDPIEAVSTVTALFTMTNRQSDSVRLMSHVDAPPGWMVLTGKAQFVMPARSSDVLMLSIAIPARVRAGTYPLRVALTTPELFSLATDSVVIVIPERRALEMELLDRPAYAVSPRSYDAVFLLRNRGNVAAAVRLTARSSLGAARLVGNEVAQLAPDESRIVRVRVRPPARIVSADDDVVELVAIAGEDTTNTAHASARITVVPSPDGTLDAFARVPAQLRLRTAGSSGVSPFELAGAGLLRDGGTEQLEFLLRGRGQGISPFTERDEYRFELRAPLWRMRLGDHYFSLSPLTNPGRVGVGAGADLTRGAWTGGAHAQAFRHEPGRDREAGAFVGARLTEGARLTLNMVQRSTSTGSVNVASTQATFRCNTDRADVELARSGAVSGAGFASSARISGTHRRFAYDAGFQGSDTAFAGSEPGATHAFASANARPTRATRISMNASSHLSNLGQSTGVMHRQRLDLGTVAATLADRLTMELSTVARGTRTVADSSIGRQQSVRLHGRQTLRGLHLSLGVERGLASTSDTSPRSFTEVQAAARGSVLGTSLGAFVTRFNGKSLTKGAEDAITIGGDASIRLFTATSASFSAFTTRHRVPGARWQSLLDGRLGQMLPNGATLSLRLRLAGNNTSTTEHSAAFLEYSMPLRLPVSRLRTPGRVQGRIVDAGTGRGVSNAIVRVGRQVAVTDSKGQVAFGRVPAGEHRVSLAQEVSLADAVFIGDPMLRVDSARGVPITFQLRVARAARVDVVVRRFSAVRTALDGAADSLAVAGLQADVILRLTNQRDTIYRHTDAEGRTSFTDVPPGRWTVAVHSDAPALHRFDPDRQELTLAAGEAKAMAFRLVPRQRDVQIIGPGEELRPVPRERGTGNREKGNHKSGTGDRE